MLPVLSVLPFTQSVFLSSFLNRSRWKLLVYFYKFSHICHYKPEIWYKKDYKHIVCWRIQDTNGLRTVSKSAILTHSVLHICKANTSCIISYLPVLQTSSLLLPLFVYKHREPGCNSLTLGVSFSKLATTLWLRYSATGSEVLCSSPYHFKTNGTKPKQNALSGVLSSGNMAWNF